MKKDKFLRKLETCEHGIIVHTSHSDYDYFLFPKN